MKHKHKAFTSLSRRKRRAKAQHIKNLIHRERHRCGGMFYDDCDIPAAIASGNWNWSDIIFTSLDPAVFWNAEIITAGVEFADRVEQLVFDEAWALLDADGQERESSIETVPNLDASGKVISHTWVRQPDVTYPQFGGLTWREYTDKRALEIARDNPPSVYCGYRIQTGYASGIGLQIMVDAELLTVELIEAAITDFRARGEKNWISTEPAHVSYTSDFHCKPLAI
ncbi:hypothetical protein N7563_21985 [Leclercia adecarboxylata ATCC 23216 = NBRC 102595]|nr:hypothetical protein [Leclercia adecarboxylata ATCC 23216 = NBRC 102595]